MEARGEAMPAGLSRRDFLGYSSLSVLGALLPGSLAGGVPAAARMNPLFDTKLRVKFVLGGMVHETAHEGPCRVGKLENLTQEAEMRGFQERFRRFAAELGQRAFPPEVEILRPVAFRMLVKEKDIDFKFPDECFAEVEAEIAKTDLLVVMQGFASDIALKLAERFGKPVATIGQDWIVDVPAALRHRGYESYAALDWDDFNQLAHTLWVRQAFAATKLLIVTDRLGQAPFGLSSAIYDFDQLRDMYGMGHHCVSNRQLAQEMDTIIGSQRDQQEAERIAKALMANARAVHMTEAHVINSVNFYLAVTRLMQRHECNAFTIECREICPLEIAAKYQFTPCMTLSLLKDQGYPAVCQTDINALIPMMALSYLGRRSVYMGNPVFDAKNNLLTIFHDVPGLQMKGFDTSASAYELRNFTVGGWGVTLRYDFSADAGQAVTIARANPGQTKILMTRGEIVDGFGVDQISCSLGVRVKIQDARNLYRHAADYGAHFVMAYGDYLDQMEELSRVAGFELTVV